MKASRMGAALAASIVLGQIGYAEAAFTSEQLKCRGAIAKVSSKLASAIDKAVTGCNKTRNTKNPAQDCSTIDAADAAKGLVAKAEAALESSVGGAKDACLGITPATMGFDACPSPCNGTVPAINDFDDVAECLICSIRGAASAGLDDVMGDPTVPLGGIEAKCHGTLGKSYGKMASTVIKTRVKCQNAADKAGAMDTTSCASVNDPAITSTRGKGQDSILSLCSPADLPAVDSCDTSSITGLQNCSMNKATTAGQSIYLYMYGEEPTGPFTWSEINTIFQATCGSMTCHSAGGDQGGFTLGTSLSTYNELVGASEECGSGAYTTRVVAGNPDTSFLMDKLNATNLNPPDCGDPMPLLLPQLDATTRERIRLWIEGGAPFN